VKQLGATYYIFPGAAHNRFEHSIGTGYLAQKQVRHLKKVQPDLDINEDIEQAVVLAGLLHDMGHGPFSHIFDHMVADKIGVLNYKHEEQSARIVEHIVDMEYIDLDSSVVKLVQNLILGDPVG
jgi:HD superfamily phosphohydrolase